MRCFSWRFAVLLAAAFGLEAHSARAEFRPHRTAKTPNVVIILADDLGYGDLGCYGQSEIKTPNIDRLAAEGMLFTQAYAGNTVCAPSRCALMTGRHSGHGQVRSNTQAPLAAETPNLPRVFHAAGYVNAAIGKWALGWEGSSGQPNRQGFDEFLGFYDQRHAHTYYPAWLWRNERTWIWMENANGKHKGYAPDLFMLASTNFIRINEYSPFFLYLASTIPHANNELGTNGMEVPSYSIYKDKPWPLPEKGKAAMITRLDAHVRRVMETLAKHNLDNDTIVIFTSDNGPHAESGVDPAFFHSSGPFRGIKRDLYEGGIRVPFIVRWPGHIRPNSTNALPVAFWDVLPTVAELVGVAAPKGIDGLSFAPSLLGGEPVQKHECFYWESHERGYQRAARCGDWKAVKPKADQPAEIYNLATDPGETHDVAAANPDIAAKMEKYMEEAADPFVESTAKSPYSP